MPSQQWQSDGSLPRSIALAFAPVHKSALGIAVGLAFGALLGAITIFHVALNPPNAPDIGLLAQYFYGYTVSWSGAAIGFFWGVISGFVIGWFVAFVRNFTLAVWLLFVRTKAQLSQPFLDHI